MGLVHEQRHGVLATVQADPLVEPSDDGFGALVAMPLDHGVDVFVAQGVGLSGFLHCRCGGVGVGHAASMILFTRSIRSPIQRALVTHQELPSALYRGPSGHCSGSFLPQAMRV
ncbi:hypothetical protein D3C71_1763900 [compost metagenome]